MEEIDAIKRRVDREAILAFNSLDEERQRRDRISTGLFGLLVGAQLVLAVISALEQSWFIAALYAIMASWVGLAWYQDRIINRLRFILDMKGQLDDIKEAEIKRIIEQEEEQK